MFTLAKRLGTGALGLAVLGLAAPAFGQQPAANNNPGGFRVGGNAGGPNNPLRVYTPPAAVGFNYSAYGAGPAAGSPYGSLMTSPYMSGATMTSSGYDSNYSPYGYGNYILPDPYSGYLRGAADVINAQGRYMINTQQAYLLKEEVRRAKLENRRRIFDEWLYERQNTPTLNDVREQIQRDELRRSRNDPPKPEISSGKALTALLLDAQKLQTKGIKGPEIDLDEDVVKRINLSSGRDSSNFGLLKNGPKLIWPLALRGMAPAREAGELRDQLQSLVEGAYTRAQGGQAADPGTFNEIDRCIARLNNMLVKQVNDISFNEYTEAKGYLKQLDDSVRVLKQADATNHINGQFTPKANSVADLVKFMTDKGLQFGPATTGDYNAYIALHRALVAYDVGATTMAAERER